MPEPREPRGQFGSGRGRSPGDTDRGGGSFDPRDREAEQTRSEEVSALDAERFVDQGEVELIIIAHPDPREVGRRIRVTARALATLGRAESADVRLTGSSSVSRLHARFRFASGRVTIEDAGSRNGTFINGRRIAGAVELHSGARLQLGGVHCKFLRELDVEAAYHDALLELAVRDGLTGLYNRRFFEEEIEREVARARRHDHPLALILVDVDEFKSVNDSYGHVAGDQVLRELSAAAGEVLRAEQVLARVGGDEFAVVCPDTRAEQAAVLAERLRAALAGHAMRCLEGAQTVTCSFGVARLVSDDEGWRELFERADRALYRSKGGGRNRVTNG